MASETIIVHKTGRKVTCKRCSHTWDYYGQKIRANCPICRTTVTFDSSPYNKKEEVLEVTQK